MTDEIKVKVFRNGELKREVTAPNVVVIAEFERGEIFNDLGIESAIMILAQLNLEYDRLLKIIKDNWHLKAEDVSELVKQVKVELREAKKQ